MTNSLQTHRNTRTAERRKKKNAEKLGKRRESEARTALYHNEMDTVDGMGKGALAE